MTIQCLNMEGKSDKPPEQLQDIHKLVIRLQAWAQQRDQ